MSSGSISRRSEGDSSGPNEDGDEEEEKGSGITVTDTQKEYKSKKRRLFGRFGVGVRESNKALLFRLRKFSRRSQSTASPQSDSRKNSSLNSGNRSYGGGLCCFACLSKPYVIEEDDSQGHGIPDDPEEFSYEHIKSMIEKNDFYSKECDTFFDD